MLWELVEMLGNLIVMETLAENTMQDKTWRVMNDLQEAFRPTDVDTITGLYKTN